MKHSIAAVNLSERYINDRNLPDKAIDLIDEASAAVRLTALQSTGGAYSSEEKSFLHWMLFWKNS